MKHTSLLEEKFTELSYQDNISNPSRLNLIRAFPQKLTIGVLTFGDCFKGSKFNHKDLIWVADSTQNMLK